MNAIFEILIIIGLVLVNGFFVAAEFALVGVRVSRLEELIKDNVPMAAITKRAVDKLNDMLSVCQVGITMASLLLGFLGEKFVAHGLIYVLKSLEIQIISADLVEKTAIAISFAIITFLHIVLGELVPKSMAIQNTENIALRCSVPLFFFFYLFYPIVYLMNRLTSSIMKASGLDHKTVSVHSAEELMILIEEQNRHGKIDNNEFKMIRNTFEFGEQEAKSIMTHRTSIIGIDSEEKMKDLIPFVAKHNFSRYPVFDQSSIDKIVGIVHVQSIIEWLAKHERKQVTVKSIMQPPVFIPETLPLDKVLQKLRANNQIMAIVVDEYGGVAGLLTLEDIVEEIFGPIFDETDSEENTQTIKAIKPDFLLIDGEAELNELTELLVGENLEDFNDVRTIAGFFLEKHMDMPQEGSSILITNGVLTVEKMDVNKIVQIKYEIKKKTPEKTKEKS